MAYVLVPTETFFFNRRIPVYGALKSYLKKLDDYNLLPLFVTPFVKKAFIEEIYQLADGIYFMGGSDFDPKHYGQKKHKKTMATEKLRDKLELTLLRRTLKDKKPFLGLCRGCQALAIVSGGTLVQHVPDAVHHERHSLKSDQTYNDLVTQKKHPVIIGKSSRIYKILKKDRIMVNSGHHQAAATVGKDFRITGKSEDGIAEIIEHTDPDYFCFAVQPHPEAEKKTDFEPLFAAFAAAVLKHNKSRKNCL